MKKFKIFFALLTIAFMLTACADSGIEQMEGLVEAGSQAAPPGRPRLRKRRQRHKTRHRQPAKRHRLRRQLPVRKPGKFKPLKSSRRRE